MLLLRIGLFDNLVYIDTPCNSSLYSSDDVAM